MNKIVVISMIKNEADIIESFLRYCFTFADEILITDHDSTDKSLEIIEAVAAEGMPITIWNYYDSAFIQGECMTRMMRYAAEKLEADVIVPLDADEFIVSKNANAVKTIISVMKTNEIWQLEWINHYLIDSEKDKNICVVNRECIREEKSERLKKVIIGKDIALNSCATIALGNHCVLWRENGNTDATVKAGRLAVDVDIYIAHFRCRSIEQYTSKMALGYINAISLHGNYGNRDIEWSNGLKKILKNELELPKPQKAIKCGKLHNETIYLQYTRPCEINIFARVLEKAITVANELAVKSLYISGKRIFYVLFLNDYYEETLATLNSLIQQDYLPGGIICVDMLDGKLENIFDNLEREILHSSRINYEYVSIENYNDYLELVSHIKEIIQDNYINFVEPGDVFHNDAAKKMLINLENYMESYCIYTNRKSGNLNKASLISNRLELTVGNSIIIQLQKMNVSLSGGLGGFLFRSAVLDKKDSLYSYLIHEASLEKSFLVDVLMNKLFIVTEEILLEDHI